MSIINIGIFRGYWLHATSNSLYNWDLTTKLCFQMRKLSIVYLLLILKYEIKLEHLQNILTDNFQKWTIIPFKGNKTGECQNYLWRFRCQRCNPYNKFNWGGWQNKIVIKSNQRLTTREMAENLAVSFSFEIWSANFLSLTSSCE